MPLLQGEAAGRLRATTIIEWLEEKFPGRFSASQLRTLQRRLQDWRALNGPDQEVYFPQEHPPAREAQIDFTHCNSLGVNIGGRPYRHLLFQSIPGAVYPRDSVAEMAQSIAQHDAGWSHIFQSDLDRIDQYSACGCEVVVTDPIKDVPAMRQDLEVDRNALWEQIRDLNGYDLALDPAGTPPTS